MDIIQYLFHIIQYLYQMNCQLLLFICRYIPLKQWAHDDSHSPKYQKFKTDKLPKIIYYEKWDYREYIPYLEWRYGKKIKPVARRKECDIPDECTCPAAMLRSLTCTKTTAPKVRFSVKSALPLSPQKKTALQNLTL